MLLQEKAQMTKYHATVKQRSTIQQNTAVFWLTSCLA